MNRDCDIEKIEPATHERIRGILKIHESCSRFRCKRKRTALRYAKLHKLVVLAK